MALIECFRRRSSCFWICIGLVRALERPFFRPMISQGVSFVLRRCFQSLRLSRRCRTIFALSSGQTRAAIAVIRVSGMALVIQYPEGCNWLLFSGSKASSVLESMTKWTPAIAKPQYLYLTPVRHPTNQDLLDKAMAVWMPGTVCLLPVLRPWLEVHSRTTDGGS